MTDLVDLWAEMDGTAFAFSDFDTLIFGLDGDDTIVGADQRDLISGGIGDDSVSAGAGDDSVFGALGDDSLEGQNGNDALDGGAGDDRLKGGRGNDQMYGGLGDDTLRGNGGDDTIDGGVGRDKLISGQGVDDLTGGSGRDTFAFDGDPFAVNVSGGAPRIENDGVRQVVNGADNTHDNIQDFSVDLDDFGFEDDDFGLSEIRFFNGAAADGTTDLTGLGDANVIVVGSFANAGAAANAIAAVSDLGEPGVFLYFNSTLNVNRLAYSEDLGADNGAGIGTGDLSLLATLRDSVGQDAIELLPTFTDANFILV
jgi:Ca2+-binding RTX toxin-like protein